MVALINGFLRRLLTVLIEWLPSIDGEGADGAVERDDLCFSAFDVRFIRDLCFVILMGVFVFIIGVGLRLFDQDR